MKQEIGKIQYTEEMFDIISDTLNVNSVLNESLTGDSLKYVYNYNKYNINVYALFEKMYAYQPNDYIKNFIDKISKQNLFSLKFDEFNVYKKLYDILCYIKSLYKKDIIVLLSTQYIDDYYKQNVQRYKDILNELNIKYIQNDLEHINLSSAYNAFIFNKTSEFIKRYGTVEKLYLNEPDLFIYNKIVENTKISEYVYDDYHFDINFFQNKYHQDIYKSLDSDKIIKDVYQKINNKHLVIIDETLYTSNNIKNILTTVEHTYNPKSITVITAVSKIIKEEK